jgi:tetratricopeptide (TPR) repeat protein
MRFLRIILALALGAASSAGAATLKGATLKGIVLEDEAGGPPASDVTISSPGANYDTTHLEGQFKLIFSQLKPGDPVHVSAAKPGYVVVNHFEQDPILPGNPDAKPLVIIICRLANREEMALRFIGVRSLKAIKEEFQKLLKDVQSSSAAEMALLREERDQAKKAAGIAKKLAQVEPGQSSQLHNLAIRLLVDGKVDQALKALDEEELRHSLEVGKRAKEEAEKTIEQAAKDLVLRAQLLSSSNSYAVNDALASVNQILERYAVAISAYEHCLEVARRNGDDMKVSKILDNLSKLHHDQKQIEDARKIFEEALKTFRDLAWNSQETYLSDAGTTQNKLGLLHRDNQMQDALTAFHRGPTAEEASKTKGDWAATNYDCNPPVVPTTLIHLGNLDSIQSRMDEASRAYEEALKVCRDLASEKPETYVPYVAVTLISLGVLYRSQNRMEEARNVYSEALKIYQGF